MKEKSTTANTHSNFEVTELGADDFAPDYEDEARQSICRGCPFMGDGCNACLHDYANYCGLLLTKYHHSDTIYAYDLIVIPTMRTQIRWIHMNLLFS